jgi:molybdopterin synthase sulfur carrier subunit
VKTIRLLASLRDKVGAKTLEVPVEGAQTVREIIGAIAEISPALAAEIVNEGGELTGRVQILVNGRHIQWLQGLDTPVSEADELVLVPPLAGGT